MVLDFRVRGSVVIYINDPKALSNSRKKRRTISGAMSAAVTIPTPAPAPISYPSFSNFVLT